MAKTGEGYAQGVEARIKFEIRINEKEELKLGLLNVAL